MDRWSNEYHAFEIFFKSGDGVVRMKRLFRQHFDIGDSSVSEAGYETSSAVQNNSICSKQEAP